MILSYCTACCIPFHSLKQEAIEVPSVNRLLHAHSTTDNAFYIGPIYAVRNNLQHACFMRAGLQICK